MMKVPLLDLRAQHEMIHSAMLAAIENVLHSQVFILGPDVNKLEERVAAYCQCQYGIGVSSGTDALLVSLMALGVGPGDEVITTPYSFFATAGAIARLGAKPVFADIDPLTYSLDPVKVEQAITPRTKAIIPVHLYGQCADMDSLMKIARAAKVYVIEDAAQAIGAEYPGGRRAGSMGDVGCLSFFPSKNLGGVGDGGMVVTNNPDLAEKIRILRVHGGRPKYNHKIIGGNFRLDTIQAAVLNVKFNYLDGWTAQRRENAMRYRALVNESRLIEKGLITLPEAVYENAGLRHAHIYNQFVVRVQERDRLLIHLNQKGVGAEVYYPLPFHLQECFRYLGYTQGSFPIAERAAGETLALPIFPELSLSLQRYVVGCIKEFGASLAGCSRMSL